MRDLLHTIVDFFVALVSDMGYWGIIALMFLESSFFPFPSEVVIVPAGYLAFLGDMNMPLVILAGTLGSLLGAIFNYYLALKLGRAFILKYGKYFFFTQKNLEKVELFFENHGSISTFLARLIVGIRQYISLPAGLSKMNFTKFCIYTTLGSFIWVSVLATLGYFLGQNSELLHKYLFWISIAIFIIALILSLYYFKKYKTTNNNKA